MKGDRCTLELSLDGHFGTSLVAVSGLELEQASDGTLLRLVSLPRQRDRCILEVSLDGH